MDGHETYFLRVSGGKCRDRARVVSGCPPRCGSRRRRDRRRSPICGRAHCSSRRSALAVGVTTRVIAGAGAAAALIIAAAGGRTPTVAEGGFVLIAAGIALIGPGAYSIDAALFGRRTVHLPD